MSTGILLGGEVSSKFERVYRLRNCMFVSFNPVKVSAYLSRQVIYECSPGSEPHTRRYRYDFKKLKLKTYILSYRVTS